METINAKPLIRTRDTSACVDPATRIPNVTCVRSDSLFGKAREILIEHSGAYYRLRVTHSNKLILTK
jgi:hemin uptake protein HemP